MVYFVQGINGGPIKIGYTSSENMQLRLASLQCGSPVKLRVLSTITGGTRMEAELHARFAGDRLHGEWFDPSAELLTLASGKPQHERPAWQEAPTPIEPEPQDAATLDALASADGWTTVAELRAGGLNAEPWAVAQSLARLVAIDRAAVDRMCWPREYRARMSNLRSNHDG